MIVTVNVRTRRQLLRLVVAQVALLGLFFGRNAAGQLGIDLTFDRQYYLRYEPVKATVRLRNYTGNRLNFDRQAIQENASLRFDIQTHTGTRLEAFGRGLNPVSGLNLAAGETREIQLMLNSFYNLQSEGSYTVSVRLSHPRLKQDYTSAPRFIEIQEGVTEWTREVGVPSPDLKQNIQSRRASLVVLRERIGDTYCLRIEDSEMVYAVLRLGPRLGGASPECDVDGLSQIHVLHQSQPRLYAYVVYDINGKLIQRKNFVVDKSSPVLYRDDDLGMITVRGGRLAMAGVDFQEAAEGRKPVEGLLIPPQR